MLNSGQYPCWHIMNWDFQLKGISGGFPEGEVLQGKGTIFFKCYSRHHLETSYLNPLTASVGILQSLQMSETFFPASWDSQDYKFWFLFYGTNDSSSVSQGMFHLSWPSVVPGLRKKQSNELERTAALTLPLAWHRLGLAPFAFTTAPGPWESGCTLPSCGTAGGRHGGLQAWCCQRCC